MVSSFALCIDQSSKLDVEELREPCLKHVAALFSIFIIGLRLALSFFSSQVFNPSAESFCVPSLQNYVFYFLSVGWKRFFQKHYDEFMI